MFRELTLFKKKGINVPVTSQNTIMKKTLLFFIVSVISTLSVAQIPVYDTGVIKTNAVSALFTADGTLNSTKQGPAYFVPQDSMQATIYCGALWVGGLDAGHQLHMAAQTYHQNGTDFWPGPMMNNINYSPHQDTLWNHAWIVLKSTIDSFKQGKFGQKVPRSILNWPANGDTSLGEMATLAPYVSVSASGYYNPQAGDYPLIRGDEALYIIFNDDRGAAHTETRGKKLGIEIHLMVYEFKSADTTINEATFLHYDIYNRSKNDYNSVYLGNWIDMDVGNGADNYIGCDSVNNYWYTCDARPYDPNGTGQYGGEKGYGYSPPAQSLAYMCDTMTHFMYYNNDFSQQGNPLTAYEYYDYLENIWIDSTHSTYGRVGYAGNIPTNYMYSGNPFTLAGWSEVSAGNQPGDRRGMSSTGPYTFKAATEKSLDLALVFSQGKAGYGNAYPVTMLGPRINDIRNFYNSQSYTCDETLTGVPVINSTAIANSVLAYPNPASTEITFKMSTGDNRYITILDITGRSLWDAPIYNNQVQLNVTAYPAGIYLYEITNKSGEITGRGKFSVMK
jgi:Secretion system C-terminal sorting domain